jgi:hypothetical protein
VYGTIIDIEEHARLLEVQGKKNILDRLLRAVTESLMCQKVVIAIPDSIRFSISGANTKFSGIDILKKGLPPSEVFYHSLSTPKRLMHQIMRMTGMSVAIRLSIDTAVVQGFLLDEALSGVDLKEYSCRLGRLTFEEACTDLDKPMERSQPIGPAENIGRSSSLLWEELDRGASWQDVMLDLANYRSAEDGQKKLP